MKLKWTIFSLCLVFAVAATIPVSFVFASDAQTKSAKVQQRKKKRLKKVRKNVPAAPTAAPSATMVTPTAEVANPAPTEPAAEPKVDTFRAWLEGLKTRLGRSESRANKIVSVAAVRGDEVADSAPLYWKGKRAALKAELPEQKDFEAAIDIALAGDKVAAKERLQSFLLAYPKSSLAGDAQETLKRLEAN